ncbi:MAG: ABC transporter ATP-binding protein, partial [Kiritimatiellae bacterium]|nr:ABC transporter ATP-binding protein [Kiritimatiellia bacterium]
IVAGGVTRVFSGRPALRSVSFALPVGSVTALHGPNGSGKSTLLQILCGVLAPTSGSASVAGHDTFLATRHTRALIGYLPETCPLYGEMRIEEYLRYRAALFSLPRATLPSRLRRVLDACGLAPFAKSVVHRLPLGLRQRTGLAAAILHDPAFLLLDEPFRGVDPAAIQEISRVLRDLATSRRTTILFATHNLAAASLLADRVLLLSAGTLAADAPLADFVRGGSLADAYLASLAPALSPAP